MSWTRRLISSSRWMSCLVGGTTPSSHLLCIYIDLPLYCSASVLYASCRRKLSSIVHLSCCFRSNLAFLSAASRHCAVPFSHWAPRSTIVDVCFFAHNVLAVQLTASKEQSISSCLKFLNLYTLKCVKLMRRPDGAGGQVCSEAGGLHPCAHLGGAPGASP